ncbi:response regulator [Hyalangium minutum]|nr:response regulator [Hyalangium minutum]
MSRTVLILEDDADIRAALSALLDDAGMTVAAAAHGLAGLELLERIDTPCLIFLDWLMPVMSGREFLECLRASPRTCTVPVVVMTAGESEPPPGIAAFLRKPFGISQVHELLARYCDRGHGESPWTDA